MSIKAPKGNLNKTILIAICFVFFFVSYLLAADKVGKDKSELTSLQQQARLYRGEGLKLQEIGDVENAMKLYQKALDLDPAYADVYNDLGVIYEATGEPERAEESYIQALRVNPHLLGAYSNLALFYEGKRDLTNAAYYWKKRADLGDVNDLWTLKAQQRLEDIHISLSQDPLAYSRKNDTIELMREVSNDKYVSKYEKGLASSKIKDTKIDYKNKDYTKALDEAFDAYYKDSSNKEAADFIDKMTKVGALSK